MFRHKDKPKQPVDEKESKDQKTDREAEDSKDKAVVLADKGSKEDGAGDIKELLEKNLKWSQIIYEQNRKINHKLMWAAIAGWLRLILILAPLVLAVLYLTPIIKDVWSKFGTITSIMGSGDTGTRGGSLDDLFKMFDLSPSQKEQIKGLLK